MASLATELTAYHTNADYDETNDAAKAKKFRTACRRLLTLQPSKAAKGGGGSELEFNVELVKQELAAVNGWIARNVTDANGPDVIYPDFQDFRAAT